MLQLFSIFIQQFYFIFQFYLIYCFFLEHARSGTAEGGFINLENLYIPSKKLLAPKTLYQFPPPFISLISKPARVSNPSAMSNNSNKDQFDMSDLGGSLPAAAAGKIPNLSLSQFDFY